MVRAHIAGPGGHLSAGGGEFASEIDDLVSGTGLTASDIANRARFAGS